MKQSTLKRFLRLPRFEEHLELHRRDCSASNGNLETYDWVKEKLASAPPEVLKPPPLINGRDLLGLGVEPGPAFSEILRAVEDAQLEGALADRESALAFVRSRWLERA